MERVEIIRKHSELVLKWLKENDFNNTIDNVKLYYGLKYGTDVVDKDINEIYECISEIN